MTKSYRNGVFFFHILYSSFITLSSTASSCCILPTLDVAFTSNEETESSTKLSLASASTNLNQQDWSSTADRSRSCARCCLAFHFPFTRQNSDLVPARFSSRLHMHAPRPVMMSWTKGRSSNVELGSTTQLCPFLFFFFQTNLAPNALSNLAWNRCKTNTRKCAWIPCIEA